MKEPSIRFAATPRRRGRRIDLERRLERATKALLTAGYNIGEIAAIYLDAMDVTRLLDAKARAQIQRTRRRVPRATSQK